MKFSLKRLKKIDWKKLKIIPLYGAQHYAEDIGKKVDENTFLYGEEGCIHVIVLDENGYKYYNLKHNYTLKDIEKMYKTKGTIKVIYDEALKGFVYEYGNYRDKSWYLVGVTQGYA